MAAHASPATSRGIVAVPPSSAAGTRGAASGRRIGAAGHPDRPADVGLVAQRVGERLDRMRVVDGVAGPVQHDVEHAQRDRPTGRAEEGEADAAQLPTREPAGVVVGGRERLLVADRPAPPASAPAVAGPELLVQGAERVEEALAFVGEVDEVPVDALDPAADPVLLGEELLVAGVAEAPRLGADGDEVTAVDVGDPRVGEHGFAHGCLRSERGGWPRLLEHPTSTGAGGEPRRTPSCRRRVTTKPASPSHRPRDRHRPPFGARVTAIRRRIAVTVRPNRGPDAGEAARAATRAGQGSGPVGAGASRSPDGSPSAIPRSRPQVGAR